VDLRVAARRIPSRLLEKGFSFALEKEAVKTT
jgi:hypothetical protein